MNLGTFIDILKDNNEDKLKQFLLENGKKPKPFSPFYFVDSNIENEKEEVQ